jgi:hypothetical protein
MTTIEITGLTEAIAACQRAPEVIARELQPAVEASLLSLLPDLADYPSPPAGSTYRRTGTLGRTWTSARPIFSAMSSGFEATIGNSTPYAGFVQGAAEDTPHQAWMHKERWKTADSIVEKHKGEIEGRIQAAVDRTLQELS